MCDICSKLTIKTPKRGQWCLSSIFIVNFEHISLVILVFPLLAWKKMTAAWEIWLEIGDLQRPATEFYVVLGDWGYEYDFQFGGSILAWKSYGVWRNHQRCSMKKGVLRNFTKFTGEHLCVSLFFNKIADLRPATLLKKKLSHTCFLVNFAKFLRTSFLQNTSGRLLLWCSMSVRAL